MALLLLPRLFASSAAIVSSVAICFFRGYLFLPRLFVSSVALGFDPFLLFTMSNITDIKSVLTQKVIAAAKVSHFEILCRVHSIEPTVGLFRCFYVNSKNDHFSKRPDSDVVKVGERERAEGEAKLLDSTIRRVVPLLPVDLARAESELEASVDRLFDEGGCRLGGFAVGGGQDAKTELVTGVRIIVDENVAAEKPKCPRKKRPAVTDASGSSHPPKKLRGDYKTSSGATTSGKSSSVLKELLESSMLNVEVGVTAVATLPLVTSSVSATPEHESGTPTDSITMLNLCTIVGSDRFVTSSDSSHHSSTHASGAEGDSVIRSTVVPSLMTEAVVTSHAVNASSVLVSETGAKVTSSVHASMFHDSDSTKTVKADVLGLSYSAKHDLSMGSRELNAETLHQVFVPQWNVLNDSILDDSDVSQEFVDHLAPLTLFSQIREMDYHHLFTEFNVRTACQACLNAEVRMRTEEVSATEATERMHADEIDALKQRNVAFENEKDYLDGKVVELQFSVAAKDLEVHALETTCSSLRGQVSGYERLKEQIKEFQDAQMNIINDKVAKLDVDLLEMALYLEEKFYPHLLNTISSQRWPLTRGIKCLYSQEYLTALGSAINRAIEKGMQDGLSAGIDHEKAGRSAASTSGSVPVAVVATTALFTTFTFASSVPPVTTDNYDIVNVDGQEDVWGNVASFPTFKFEKKELDTNMERDSPS
nr:hypothetical protein [Tanacetum cinerariifolium]